MKIAVVHVLPLEYYPPVRNMLKLFAERRGWDIRAWTTSNSRGMRPWSSPAVTVRRPHNAKETSTLPLRLAGYASWHLQTALELRAWKPDAVIYIEPHSALAVSIFYKISRARTPLFIHHHEYYAPEDYEGPGMRVLRATRKLERNGLFPRASWVSQTNDQRLRLLLAERAFIRRESAYSLPNYPPTAWVKSADVSEATVSHEILRIVYVGSASFHDTFIREAVEWAAAHRDTVSLHICGDNVQPNVVSWIRSLASGNVTVNDHGVDYEKLPSFLRSFDVGLVLYRGNTLNFVHNVPNKAVEYLACGLQVWYPGVMEGMVHFHQLHPQENLREMNFEELPAVPPTVMPRPPHDEFPFTAERALRPLIARLEAMKPYTS